MLKAEVNLGVQLRLCVVVDSMRSVKIDSLKKYQYILQQ